MPTRPFAMPRRRFLYGAGALLGSAALLPRLASGNPSYGRPLGPVATPRVGRLHSFDFTAAERATQLPCFRGRKLPMWTFEDAAYPTVIRVTLGDSLEIKVTNNLPGDEHLTVHWHGLRI